MEPYQQLEKEWAEWNGIDPAGMVACSSGTAALHLALEALRLPPGSEVIVPDFTMIAVPRAVALAGLVPVFVDCDERLNMDASLLTGLGSTTADRALIAVHTYGRQCSMENIGWWCKVHAGGPIAKPLMLVEDLAEAHGVKPNRYTDAACWSFYKNKIVAGGEGGAVWFRDPEHARLTRRLRNLGFTDEHDFTHVPRGHNYRMSNAHANLILRNFKTAVDVAADLPLGSGEYGKAVSWQQLNKGLRQVHRLIEQRRQIESWYDAACPDEWRMPPRDAPWVYDMRIKGLSERKQYVTVRTLNAEGIAARHAFKPASLQQEFRLCRRVSQLETTVADGAGREVIYLPIQPGVTAEADCRRAFDVIHRVLGQ